LSSSEHLPYDPDEFAPPGVTAKEAQRYEQTVVALARKALIGRLLETPQLATRIDLSGSWPDTALSIHWRHVHNNKHGVAMVPLWQDPISTGEHESPNLVVGHLVASWMGHEIYRA
jgi:hypothetical protein